MESGVKRDRSERSSAQAGRAPVTDPPEAMKSIRLERGLARPSDLAKALDRLGVRQGECFVVMSVRHRDELNQMSWKARTT